MLDVTNVAMGTSFLSEIGKDRAEADRLGQGRIRYGRIAWDKTGQYYRKALDRIELNRIG